MAVSLKALKGGEKVIPVTYGDETFDVAYLPGEFTGDLLATVADTDETKATAALDAMLALLLPVLVRWDIEDENGENLPITSASLRAVPLAVLRAILGAIQEDSRPGEAPAPSVSS